MVSIFPICKSRDHKENFLKFSLQYIQLFKRNCRDTKFWLCLTDHAWSKSFLFAYLGTLKNISWSFQLNVSSRLGGIVQTKFWLCLIDIGCSKVLSGAKLETRKKISRSFQLNLSSITEELSGQNFGYALLTGLTVDGQNFCQMQSRDNKEDFLKFTAQYFRAAA